jgi:hypothetical protein
VQDLLHHPVEFASLSAHPIVIDPAVKVRSFDEQFPVQAMMGQRGCAIGQTIAQPAYGAGGVGRQGPQIEISRVGERGRPGLRRSRGLRVVGWALCLWGTWVVVALSASYPYGSRGTEGRTISACRIKPDPASPVEGQDPGRSSISA